MTAHAHARRRVLGRLLDLARGHGPVPAPPDLYPMRAADYGDGPKIVSFWNDWTDGPGLAYDTSYDHPDPAVYAGGPQVPEDAVYADDSRPEPHPPWQTAPQPALAGPGRLGAFYAAADLRAQRAGLAAEHESWYGWGAPLDASEARVRPYAPGPEPAPVSYPPLSFKADFRDLPVFRTAARKCGLAPAGLVRAGGVTLP